MSTALATTAATNEVFETNAFECVAPEAYDTWRHGSEFFQRIEFPLITKELAARSGSRVLDVGCGTGLWSSVLNQLHPHATVLGVDCNDDFISYAASTYASPRVSFTQTRAETYRDDTGFDVIVAAMSLDYVGIDAFLSCVHRNLGSDGTAVAWMLSPVRYERVSDGHCVKGWYIGGSFVEVTVEVVSPSALDEGCRRGGLQMRSVRRTFALDDGLGRELWVFEIRRSR